MTSGSLWSNYRDNVSDDANENIAANNRINNGKTVTKYLINFWRSLDLSFINCEIELDLSWWKGGIISEIAISPGIVGGTDANPPVLAVTAIQATEATFQINNANLYFPVVTLSTNNNFKFLKNVKQRLKRTIYWNKYRSQITTWPKSDNLDYLIYPSFRNINRLCVLSFKNATDDSTRHCFDKYFMLLIEINDFNVLIDNKPIFDTPAKNKQD